jgi:hypothetical protein
VRVHEAAHTAVHLRLHIEAAVSHTAEARHLIAEDHHTAEAVRADIAAAEATAEAADPHQEQEDNH